MIRLLWFAALADMAGVREETRPLAGPMALSLLWQELMRDHPGLRAQPRPAFARNGRACSSEERAEPGDTIAFLPPVSGG